MQETIDNLIRDHHLAHELRSDHELPAGVRAVISRVTATIEAERHPQQSQAYTIVRTCSEQG